jgi:hypothetical protein
VPRLQQPIRGRRLARKPDDPTPPLTSEQRLLLPFKTEGPAGLADKPRGGPTGNRLPEVTKRAILMLKQDNPLGLREHRLGQGRGLAHAPRVLIPHCCKERSALRGIFRASFRDLRKFRELLSANAHLGKRLQSSVSSIK